MLPAWLSRAAALGLMLFAMAGCAAGSGGRIGYASWNHLVFSIHANWQQFVGWSPLATSRDEATADREGGWWGDEIPTLRER